MYPYYLFSAESESIEKKTEILETQTKASEQPVTTNLENNECLGKNLFDFNRR